MSEGAVLALLPLLQPCAAGAGDDPPLDQVLPPQCLHVHLYPLLGQLLLLLLQLFPVLGVISRLLYNFK